MMLRNSDNCFVTESATPILLVDPCPKSGKRVKRLAKELGLPLTQVSSGREALKFQKNNPIGIVITERFLSDVDCLTLLPELTKSRNYLSSAVVLFTAAKDPIAEAEAFNLGAKDYICKTTPDCVIKARFKNIVNDLRRQATLSSLAHLDKLTNLYNRRHFDRRLTEELEVAARHRRPLALILIDLDHFKSINDQWGHDGGDSVLRHVAAIISDSARDTDVVARFGGEEFAILARETSKEQAEEFANRLTAIIEKTVCQHLGKAIPVTASMGVVGVDSCDDARFLDTDTFFKLADEALYESKRQGRNRVSGAHISSPQYPKINVGLSSTQRSAPNQSFAIAQMMA
jgi:two-component system, cell cycle response regulator